MAEEGSQLDKLEKEIENKLNQQVDWQSKLETAIKERIASHTEAEKGDGWRYNWGTGFVLAATGMATFIPAEVGVWLWVGKLLSGSAAIWIGIERSLNFGSRWRWHMEMRAAYQAVIDRFNILLMVPIEKAELRKELKEITDELRAIGKREAQVPGTKK